MRHPFGLLLTSQHRSPIIMRPDTITTCESITNHSWTGVATYRGIDLGWVAVGRPRSKADTERLLVLVNRIRPDYSNKIITTLSL